MKSINISRIANILITFFSIISFVIYLYMFVDGIIINMYKRDYLYKTVYSPLLFIITILLCVVLPTLLCLGCWLSLKTKRRLTKTILCTICILLIILWIIPNIILIGFGGGIASYTDSLDNYCKYDKSVNNTINTYIPDGFFPNIEELEDKNSRYCYYYEYGMLDEFYHIQLEIRVDEPYDFSLEEIRIADFDMIPYSDDTYYFSCSAQTNADSLKSNETGECCTAVVHFDRSRQQIIYYVFRSESQNYALESVSQLDKTHKTAIKTG